ncbi:DUF2971 domain-containing protein [Caulobacter rhizosphaerae]|jgi:hypothetical protein|uniref:DUF2971 domain-containing protein n=1 Tax=Caulobacter rhizosphaerae TaxID=2010972 RepID=UPI0013D125C1|nr:DUF2971 domain-containing protein [Caulobacter rhizosphaerae]GGL29280.1 hypothetical protein GCM10010983_28200 [Caulobacter rhizosphaerae]
MPDFEDLPFNARPDMTPYLVHLTKHSKPDDDYSAFDNLVSILKSGRIMRSTPKKGFIKGAHGASCFMDVPFASMKYVLTPDNTDPQKPRYQPYGIAITKKFAYGAGCRPVLYLSNEELKALAVPPGQLWRVVRFEVDPVKGWISWLHEREWRCKGDFELPTGIQAAFVRTSKEAERLTKMVAKAPGDFACKPRSVIPFTVLCQGLLT